MPARKDFLRQIVNRVLATESIPRQIADEIRQQIGRAEDKYKFHVFGGDIRGLAKYLQSNDFKSLLQFVKGSGRDAVEAFKKILLEAKNAYGDVDEVKEAIEKALQELEEAKGAKEEATVTITDINEVFEKLREHLKKEKPQFSISKSNNAIVVKAKSLEATISFDDERKTLRVTYTVKGEREVKHFEELIDLLKTLGKL
jgi:cobalamin biosynthesis Mg chelatase CobN